MEGQPGGGGTGKVVSEEDSAPQKWADLDGGV